MEMAFKFVCWGNGKAMWRMMPATNKREYSTFSGRAGVGRVALGRWVGLSVGGLFSATMP